MDQVELQDSTRQAELQLMKGRLKELRGEKTALVGMGVLFTSLGLMSAQTLLAGTSLPAALSVPLMATTAIGLTTFAAGLSKRANGANEQDEAKCAVEDLQYVYQKRFPNE